MEMIYIWIGGLGGALVVLGCMWFRDKMDDLEDTIDSVEFELIRLREEVKDLNVSRICDK